jgi:excisionase family DNA binding protein
MSISFLTSLNEQEFKTFLKEALKEILQTNPTDQMVDRVMEAKEAADFLKLKVSTLYEKTSLKQVPHFKKGNKLYFYKSQLEQWIKEGKVKTYLEVESEASNYLLKKK